MIGANAWWVRPAWRLGANQRAHANTTTRPHANIGTTPPGRRSTTVTRRTIKWVFATHFRGTLREVHLYNRVLAPNEIRSLSAPDLWHTSLVPYETDGNYMDELLPWIS